MEPKVRVQDGQMLCLACAGEEHYVLSGPGIGCGRLDP